jgi:hypothetical protein
MAEPASTSDAVAAELAAEREPERYWTPWKRTAVPHNGAVPPPESVYAELARYVSPAALQDVQWTSGFDADDDARAQRDGERAMLMHQYQRLSRERTTFWRDPWLPGEVGQRIRHPWLLVHGRIGTCLDFATTFAAMCLQAKIPPLVAITEGTLTLVDHALVIVTPGRALEAPDLPDDEGAAEAGGANPPRVSERPLALVGDERAFDSDGYAPGFVASAVDGVVRLEDWNALERALDDESMLAIDFARSPAEPAVPIDEARRRGREHLRKLRSSGGRLWLVDVGWLQNRGTPAFDPPGTRAPIQPYLPGGRASFDKYDSHASIVSELRSAHGTVVLYGASGTGKSTIAREIAHAAQFGAAWFLTASEPQALINSLDQAERAELHNDAPALAHLDRSGFAAGGLVRLNEAREDWVVVVDNADGDPAKLLPWLPRPSTDRTIPVGVRQLVLITTTNDAWKQHFPTHELPPVKRDEAIRSLPGPELADIVAGRPLLFDAFKRMASATGWDGAQIASHSPRPDDLSSELLGPATLWAAAQEAEGFDRNVLTVAAQGAYLPPDRQPLAVAAALAPATGVAAVRDLLVRLGLLSADGDVARMHRLMGAVVRADLETREPELADDAMLLVATNDAAFELLDRHGDLATITHLEARLEALDLDNAAPSERLGRAMHRVAELLELHGHTRRSGDRYAKAERHLKGAPLLLGLGLHGRARTVNQHHANDEAQVREALGWARTAEAMLQSAGAPDKAERCLAMQGLLIGKLASFPRGDETRIGLLHESLEVIERADGLRRTRLEALDPDNPDPELLRSRFNRAGVRIKLAQEEPELAAEHLQRAHDVYEGVERARRKVYGRDQHPHVAACTIGRAYVAYYRALLVAETRVEQTGFLREATDRTIEALATRQAQEGGIDQDEVTKVVRFLTKVALARDVLAMTSADRSASSLRAKVGHRVEDGLEEIVHGLASEQ